MAAARQMQVQLLKAGGNCRFLARSCLFLSPRAGLSRNKHWTNCMESDVLIYDFQDGCPPQERQHVFQGLMKGHEMFPNKPFSVRLTELERDGQDGLSIINEIRACVEQTQVRWLMLPMCDNKHDVQYYIDMLNSIDPQWLQNHGSLKIIMETPDSLHNLDDILGHHSDIEGIVVGAGDYFRFAQTKEETYSSLLHWDVLNACLRHRRFPIHAPSLKIDQRKFPDFCNDALSSGYKSAIILHPQQVKIANDILSVSKSDADNHRDIAKIWLDRRETGYRRGSGDSFVGPPHAKLSSWLATYDSNITAKSRFFIEEINEDNLHHTRHLLSDLSRSIDITSDDDISGVLKSKENNHGGEGNHLTELIFLAMVTTCHRRHKDILFNLGYANGRFWVPAETIKEADAKHVCTTLVSRRLTSAGNRAIVVYDCEILNGNFEKIYSIQMFLMEIVMPFESFDDVDDLKPSPAEKSKRVYADEASKFKMSSTRDAIHFKSPSSEIHSDFCEYLGLHAPVHHSTDCPPVVPSTLHVTCHNLPFNSIETIVDVNFCAPMEPDRQYSRYIRHIKGKTYISFVTDDGNLLSSVTFSTKEGESLDPNSSLLFEKR